MHSLSSWGLNVLFEFMGVNLMYCLGPWGLTINTGGKNAELQIKKISARF